MVFLNLHTSEWEPNLRRQGGGSLFLSNCREQKTHHNNMRIWGFVLFDDMSIEDLVARIQRGETALVVDLWGRVRDFVHVKAQDMHAGDLTEDLEQECYFALLDAIANYDDAAGCKFLTYAGYWFKSRMHRYMGMKGGGPILPVNLLPRLRKYRRIVSDFQRDLGRKPNCAEVIAATGWTLADVVTVLENQNADITTSMDAPISDENDDFTLADTIAAEQDPAEVAEDTVFREQMRRDIWKAVNALPDQIAQVVTERYKYDLPHKDIAVDIGMPEGQTRQLCAKGLRMIRSDKKTVNQLRPYAIDLYGEGTRCGLRDFSRTWTSSTERAALKDLGVYWER